MPERPKHLLPIVYNVFRDHKRTVDDDREGYK